MAKRDHRTIDPIITLTTDYGTCDHYVAALKGVILTIAPAARIVDVTHHIDPHHVGSGAFVLGQVWPLFPEGTIHVAVVDPGVGSARRIIVGRYAGSFVVAPDNGLISFVHREFALEAMHFVEDPRFFRSPVSSTFHGRDIMASVAAHLATGVAASEFGRSADRVELLDVPVRSDRRGGAFVAQILHVDRFGTLVTNVHADQLDDSTGSDVNWTVSVDGSGIGPIGKTFSDVAAGEPLAVIGSSGYVEVAVNQGRAVDRFGRTPMILIRDRSPDAPSGNTTD